MIKPILGINCLLLFFIITACTEDSSAPSVRETSNSQLPVMSISAKPESSIMLQENKPTKPDETPIRTENTYVENNELDYPKADSFYVEALLSGYERMIIEAITDNDFSRVEKYLVKDSELYKAQKKLIADLYNRNIKEKLVNYSIEDIKNINTLEFEIYVKEEISIKYPGNEEWVNKKYSWIYIGGFDEDNKPALKGIKSWEK